MTFPFLPPPLSAIMLAPLTALPWQAAYFLWQLLCVLMMTISLYFAIYLSRGAPPPGTLIAVALAVVFFFMPFHQVLLLGNIDVVILLLWVLGTFFLSRGRVLPSAFCLALGTAIKVRPIYAIPLLAMRRQWCWLASYLGISLALLAFSLWRLGWQNHLVWVRQVAPAVASGIKLYVNRSLPGFIFALGDPHDLFTHLPAPAGLLTFAKAVSFGCYSVFLIWCWKKRRDSQGLVYEIVLLPLIVLLTSPLTWRKDYVLALLPLTYLWMRSRERAETVSKLDMILLTGSTLILGNSMPVGRLIPLFGTPFELLGMATWVAATLALIWVGMRMYKSCVADGQRAAQDLNTRCLR